MDNANPITRTIRYDDLLPEPFFLGLPPSLLGEDEGDISISVNVVNDHKCVAFNRQVQPQVYDFPFIEKHPTPTLESRVRLSVSHITPVSRHARITLDFTSTRQYIHLYINKYVYRRVRQPFLWYIFTRFTLPEDFEVQHRSRVFAHVTFLYEGRGSSTASAAHCTFTLHIRYIRR